MLLSQTLWLLFCPLISGYNCMQLQNAATRVTTSGTCATIVDSTFINLYALPSGAAIYVYYIDDPSPTVISGCNFLDCSSENSGGAVSVECQEALIRFCSAPRCFSYQWAGFLRLAYTSATSAHTVHDLAVRQSMALNGGSGVFLDSNENVAAARINFTSCYSPLEWVSVHPPWRPSAILHSIFNHGYDIYCATSRAAELVTFESCAFVFNTLTDSVIIASTYYVQVLDCSFHDNTAPPFYRDPTSHGYFIVEGCTFDIPAISQAGLFLATASNSWNDHLGTYFPTQTDVLFTNPSVTAVWMTVPSYDLSGLSLRPPGLPTQSPKPDEGGFRQLPPGEVVAIVLGSIAGVAFIVGLPVGTYYCMKKDRNHAWSPGRVQNHGTTFDVDSEPSKPSAGGSGDDMPAYPDALGMKPVPAYPESYPAVGPHQAPYEYGALYVPDPSRDDGAGYVPPEYNPDAPYFPEPGLD
jgi:hypothetical protein